MEYLFRFTIGVSLFTLGRWMKYPQSNQEITKKYIESLGAASCSNSIIDRDFNSEMKVILGEVIELKAKDLNFKSTNNGYCRLIYDNGKESDIYIRAGYIYFWDYVFGKSNAKTAYIIEGLRSSLGF